MRPVVSAVCISSMFLLSQNSIAAPAAGSSDNTNYNVLYSDLNLSPESHGFYATPDNFILVGMNFNEKMGVRYVASSKDLLHWHKEKMDTNKVAVTANNKFLTVSFHKSQGQLLKSTDGVNWKKVDFNNKPSTVFALNGKYYIFSDDGNKLYSSKHLKHWESVTLPTSEDSKKHRRSFTGIYKLNDEFISIAYLMPDWSTPTPLVNYFEILSSKDAKHWTIVDSSNFNQYFAPNAEFVQLSEKLFCFSRDHIYASSDGINWTPITDQDYIDPSSDGKMIFAEYPAGNTEMFSYDGLNWQKAVFNDSENTASQHYGNVTKSGNIYYMATNEFTRLPDNTYKMGNIFFSSKDGINWDRVK